MYQPESTYRIQFHKDFTFSDLEKIIPYLHQLGVKTIYASPIFCSVAGSLHGYDGLNPNRINPELGTLAQLKNISQRLKSLGMGWIQDFVPNHMAFSPQNEWIADLLEKGEDSVYNAYFDHQPNERIMAPFLGKPLEEALKKGEISIVFQNGKFKIQYFDNQFPLNEKSIRIIEECLQSEMPDLRPATTDAHLPFLKDKLKDLSADSSFLKSILDTQHYRLCSWRETNSRINYRRFFTVNSLICMNMEDDQVFQNYHKLLMQLVNEDIIQGIRIDHVDGLYDPSAYLNKLRGCLGDEVYIIVEKILEFNESFPSDWTVEGNTGYDFLTIVNKALTNKEAEHDFDNFYQQIVNKNEDIHHGLKEAKAQILFENMEGELQNLYELFLALPQIKLPKHINKEDFRKIIAALLINCPVYRFYPDTMPLHGKDAENFLALTDRISKDNSFSPEALAFFKKCFTEINEPADADAIGKRLHFWRRCMQFSGPLMAKGMEDTLMYRYFRFVAHNEVGDDLKTFGITTADFHQRMKERQQYFPHTLNSTATHDTKRGEDVRARLQTLSFEPENWLENVSLWMKETKGKTGDTSMADAYFIIQTIFGTLPFDDKKGYLLRIKEYLLKAAREAKLHSNWDNPNESYEGQLIQFALSVMDSQNPIAEKMNKFFAEQEDRIIINSLVQLALKCTCPGIPDIYQGTELWDLSFVDPDNRRAVDYEKRNVFLNEIVEGKTDAASLIRNGRDGKIKLFTLHKLLTLRKKYPDLFEKGAYEPLKFKDPEKYIAFARRYKGQEVVVILPRGGKVPSSNDPLNIPSGQSGPEKWKNIFTDEIFKKEEWNPNTLFQDFPIVVLESLPALHKRSAGILLPVFSLKSDFGIGGLGKEAFEFADFLACSGQKYWQILPLNPVSKANSYSPYAAVSTFASEPLYIDPEKLIPLGLLMAAEVDSQRLPAQNKVDYASASDIKSKLFKKAWKVFSEGHFSKLKQEFKTFCAQQSWLHDYSLYIVAKNKFGEKAWYEWPHALKDREPNALKEFENENTDELDYQKWLQFLFSKQWQELKLHCEQLNIRLIGDIPFYMSADSADVWQNRHLFQIDNKGICKFMAGVPPDYFDENGQLWGMPTYDWNVLGKENYNWWIRRLQRNIEVCHLLRLDHFRAFYDYWEIPATAKTAKEGNWQDGPREKLFSVIKKEIPEMPFIAEDLGELHQGVYDFCNDLKLPGMRVLQFGFENYDAASRDLPHNFVPDSIAYTGTHDNNTTAGWYQYLDNNSRNKISKYAGHKVDEKNIADTLIEIAYRSVAQTVIIPFQDILGLGEDSRVNTPATVEGNWSWRMVGDFDGMLKERLLELVGRYNR